MNEDSINALLKCQLCSKPFVDPVITTNGDRSCRSCTLSDNDHSSFVPVSEKLLLDLLDNLRVECIKCEEINIRRGDLEQHNKTTCPQRIVLCEAADLKCLWTGSYEELNPHLQSCTFELLRPIFTEILADIKQFKEQKSYYELKQCSTLTIEYDEFKKEVEEFRQERTRFQTEIQQLKNQNEQVERLLKEGITRTNELENQLEQLKQLYNRQINQNNELQTDIQQLKEQFIRQNTLYNEFQTEFNQYKQIKQSFNQNHEIQQLKEQYNQQMNQYEQLSKHVINHNTQSQKDEIIYIKQLVNQHDIQIKLLARKKCVIPGKSVQDLFFLFRDFNLSILFKKYLLSFYFSSDFIY
jgi:DNA repair exonuclease SbcCD ATPase subunit